MHRVVIKDLQRGPKKIFLLYFKDTILIIERERDKKLLFYFFLGKRFDLEIFGDQLKRS